MADETLAKQLRDAINSTDKSLRAIARDADLHFESLRRFVNGEGITLDNAGKLCKLFGMRFTKPRKKP